MEIAIGYLVNAVLGITAVGGVITAVLKGQKYVSLATEVVKLVDELLKVVADKQITQDEIKLLAANLKNIKEAYNLVRGK